MNQGYISSSHETHADHLVAIYRVCLVKDHSVSFGENCNITNPIQAQAILKDLILTRGQTDREQFIVAMLNSKKISAFAGF
jgi:hypothetical protein